MIIKYQELGIGEVFPPMQSAKLKRIHRLEMSKTAYFDTLFY